MNIVVVCSDTFRYDHLGFVGRQPVITPNLDRLARESALFPDFYLCSFPTILNRIEVFTGRYTFPLFNWGPLPFQFPVLSEVFQHQGFATGLVADNPHLMKEKFGFGRGFDFVKDVPGQADDRFLPKSAPMIELTCSPEKLDARPKRVDRYRQNAYWYRQQGTNTTATVFREAMRWIEAPQDKFFLWIDAFDPHEPWDAPEQFRQLYPWDARGDNVFWPRNGKASRYTEADLANMRSLYRAEVTQIDHWVGHLMDFLRQQKLLETTAVLFCSDHGFYLGERDLLGKLRLGRPTTIYEELGHVPLLLRHPEGLAAGRALPGLCQPADLFATVLELAGIPRPDWVQGNSLAGRLNGQPGRQQFAVGGCHPRKHNVSCLTVWTDEWCFIYSPHGGLDRSELYHRRLDPAQTDNVIASHRSVADEHFQMLCSWLDGLKISPLRRRQLLEAKEGGWLNALQQLLWRRRCQRSYRKHFGDYSRAPSAGAI